MGKRYGAQNPKYSHSKRYRKWLVSAWTSAGSQHNCPLWNLSDCGKCSGKYTGCHGLYCRTGYEPCHDYCGRSMYGSRRKGTGSLLYQEAMEDNLYHYNRSEFSNPNIPALAAQTFCLISKSI